MITFGGNRELVKRECKTSDYYKDKLVPAWNALVQDIDTTTDKRTNRYWRYHNFLWLLIYLWDYIIQDEKERNNAEKYIAESLSAPTHSKKGRVATGNPIGRPVALLSNEREKLQRMKQNGMSNRAIAKALKVNEKTIRNELKRMEVETSKQP